MKKIMFIMALAALTLPVNAANWQYVVTDNPNVIMYVDMDSVKYVNSDECLYAVRMQVGDKPEKAVFLKSNFKKLGVVRVEDYEPSSYSPKAVFANPHTFMKSPVDNPLLISAHNYILNSMLIDKYQTVSVNNNEKLVSYVNEDYTSAIRQELEDNWEPPRSGRNTQAIMILTIGSDGSLLDYNFAQPSGDDATDRSIISAVEKTAPFERFSKATPKNCQFIFDYKYFKKSVQ